MSSIHILTYIRGNIILPPSQSCRYAYCATKIFALYNLYYNIHIGPNTLHKYVALIIAHSYIRLFPITRIFTNSVNIMVGVSMGRIRIRAYIVRQSHSGLQEGRGVRFSIYFSKRNGHDSRA